MNRRERLFRYIFVEKDPTLLGPDGKVLPGIRILGIAMMVMGIAHIVMGIIILT